jgi:phage terminase small subunit
VETPQASLPTSTPDAADATSPGADWAAIEHAYCTTKQSARYIGRDHGISHTAINKRAKAAGWKRPETAGYPETKAVSVSTAAADPAPVPERELGCTLEPRQQRFVDEYLIDLNGTQAYMRVYGCSEKAARTNAARLLTNAGIQAAIAAGRAKTAATLGLTRERVLAEYAKLAFFDMRQAYHDSGALKLPHELDEDAAAAIAAYETVEMSGGDREAPPLLVRKIKWADKRAALDSIMKAQGWNKSDVGTAENPLVVRDISDAERAVRMSRVLHGNPALVSTLAQMLARKTGA